MTAIFTEAPEVKRIADELIPMHHKHLREHRVRMEYLFSDAEIETNGKAKWGEARKITSLAAFLAGEDEDAAQYEPLTFVCTRCKKWCIEQERCPVTAGDTVYYLCPGCEKACAMWDMASNKVIAQFTKMYDISYPKELRGPPTSPFFFVITIYETYWRRMRDETKRAVIDHELKHCGASLDKWGDVKLWIVPHDVEEFSDIVERHGVKWRGSLASFDRAIKTNEEQMAMKFEGTAKDAANAAAF